MSDTSTMNPHLAILRQTVEANPDGMLIADKDGNVIAINDCLCTRINLDSPAAGRMANLERLKSHLQNNTLDKEPVERLWNKVSKARCEGVTTTGDLTLIRPYPQALKVTVTPIKNGAEGDAGTMWAFADKDSNQSLETSNQQAQKIEAVGRLAGGMAHDFNNLLTAILGHTAMITQRCDDLGLEEVKSDPGSIENCTDTISQAAARASELVKQLLGYSRRTQLHREVADVNDIALDVCDELRSKLGENVEIVIDLAQILPTARIDVNQIKQAVMNICVNSLEAIGSRDGEISIFTRELHLDDPERAAAYHLDTGDYVIFSVKDTGCGMSQDLQSRVFEPFYSTKAQGQGIGLGLATAIGVVQQHKGWIDCSSEVGKGTIFNIYLPVAEVPSEEALTAEPVASSAFDEHYRSVKTKSNEATTVLLVDDEPTVRLVPEFFLKKNGFKVITANDGRCALEILVQKQNEIDLILSDLTMPNLCGDELCAEMNKRGIDIPVILCSGFLPDWEEFERKTGATAAAFIQKPYPLTQLLDTVQSVLAEWKTAESCS